MFLITEIAPTLIFMMNTRTKPEENNLFETESPEGRNSYEMNDLQQNVTKSYLEYFNKNEMK